MKLWKVLVAIIGVAIGWSLGGCATLGPDSVRNIEVVRETATAQPDVWYITGEIVNDTDRQFFVWLDFDVKGEKRYTWTPAKTKLTAYDFAGTAVGPHSTEPFRIMIDAGDLRDIEVTLKGVDARSSRPSGGGSRRSDTYYVRPIYLTPVSYGWDVYEIRRAP